MSRFPTERVILLFSTITHVVLHFIQQPNNHPFVRPGSHTRVTMPYAEQNTGILQQNHENVWVGIVAEGLSSACSGWNGILIHCGDARVGVVVVGGDFDSERDLWSRAAIVLSPPHTCYRSNRVDPAVRRVGVGASCAGKGLRKGGVHGDKKNGSDEGEGGSTLKLRSLLSLHWQTESRRLQMFHHGCEGMRGMARRTRFFFPVAMASEAMRRNGGEFCARCWQSFDGMFGGSWVAWKQDTTVPLLRGTWEPQHGTMRQRETLVKSLSSSVLLPHLLKWSSLTKLIIHNSFFSNPKKHHILKCKPNSAL